MVTLAKIIELKPAPTGLVACYECLDSENSFYWERDVLSMALIEETISDDRWGVEISRYLEGMTIDDEDGKCIVRCEKERYFKCYKNKNENLKERFKMMEEL